jgi:UDP-3-O-acyl-N-acetylglucosamine deacetylase
VQATILFASCSQVETGVVELTINGESVPVQNGSAWVDVGLLKAGVDHLQDHDVSQWLSKSSTAIPQVCTSGRFDPHG